MDYSYGSKKQWRRWCWNRAAERIADRKNALVLFLAGENAHDIEAAERKGFWRRNMIAIEKDPATVKKLRALGLLVIEGDLMKVLFCWPPERKIDLVFADFCCGLNYSVSRDVPRAYSLRSCMNAVWIVNMLRGRDADSNDLRRSFSECFEMNTKHRGEVLFTAAATDVVFGAGQRPHPEHEADLQLASERIKVVFRNAQPETYSYRSTAGTQTFDTVIYSSWCHESMKSQLAKVCSELPTPRVADLSDRLRPQRRRVSAVLAHHTMRVNARSAR